MHFARLSTLGLLMTIASAPALAHPELEPTINFSNGFVHPLSRLDHVAAMVLVGMFAARLGRPSIWLVPCAFVFAMAAGFALRARGILVPDIQPYVGTGIALSLVVLGAMLAIGVAPPTVLAITAVCLFGTFHGYAHGAEVVMSAATFDNYAAGLVVAAVFLQFFGILLGLWLSRMGEENGGILRCFAGAAASSVGVLLMLG